MGKGIKIFDLNKQLSKKEVRKYSFRNHTIFILSNLCFFNVLILSRSFFHKSLVVKKFQSVHFLSVFLILLVFHLFFQNAFMLLVNIFQVISFIFFIIEKVLSIFLPNLSLFLINFFLFSFFEFFIFYLSCKIFSHLFFLFILFSGFTLFVLFLFLKLIFNMPEHFLIFKSNLFFLILDNWISKRSHNLLNFLFSFSLLMLSFLFKFILKTSVFLLHFDILMLNKFFT